jgi:hypothetical protein
MNILATIEHADNLSGGVLDPIKHHVRARNDRSKSWPHFVSRPPPKGMIFQQMDRLSDFTNDFIGGVPPGNLQIVIPNFIKIGERLRRPNYCAPRLCHVARSRPE